MHRLRDRLTRPGALQRDGRAFHGTKEVQYALVGSLVAALLLLMVFSIATTT